MHCRRGRDVKIVKHLLNNGANVNVSGGFFGAPLHAAAARGNLGVFNLLLAAGADVNVNAGMQGYSVMQAAVQGGNKEVMRVLLEHKRRAK